MAQTYMTMWWPPPGPLRMKSGGPTGKTTRRNPGLPRLTGGHAAISLRGLQGINIICQQSPVVRRARLLAIISNLGLCKPLISGRSGMNSPLSPRFITCWRTVPAGRTGPQHRPAKRRPLPCELPMLHDKSR